MSKMGWGPLEDSCVIPALEHLAFNHERQELAHVEVRATLG